MGTVEHRVDGVVRRRWDDTTATYTEYDSDGQVVATRAYTPEEEELALTRTAQAAKDAANAQMLSRVSAALVVNEAYEAIETPTPEQVTAQVLSLTQQATALARVAQATLNAQGG